MGDCGAAYASKPVRRMLIPWAIGTLLAAGVCMGMLSCSATMPAEIAPGAGSKEEPERPLGRIPEDGVVLYYLHINVRCTTCQAMEQYARDLVMDRFGSHVVAGGLFWVPVNVQQPGNHHFLSDFQALTRSLVLERRKGGRTVHYKVLHEAWLHLIDKKEFNQYLSSEIDEFLAEPSKSSSIGKYRQPHDVSVGEQAKGEPR